MKNLTWQNPEQLFVAQVLINKVKSKCCGIKVNIIVTIMSKKSIVKFDDLDIEVLSSEQELVELAGGKGKSLLQEALEFLGADLNAGNCNCNNCNCSK